MSSVNPLTIGAEIQVAAVSTATAAQSPSVKNSKSTFGEFQSDIVNISSLARKKQQQDQQNKADQQIKNLNNEVIEVTSSIGRNTSSGNLSQEQAAALYNKIASLL